MLVIIETGPGQFVEATDAVVTSPDGDRRAPLATLLSDAYTDAERAAFGVYLVEPQPVPLGKVVTGVRYARTGNTVVQLLDLADAPVIVPESVSPRQLKLALFGAGLLDKIDAFVAASTTPRTAQISWEYATEYRRDNPLLIEMAAKLSPPMPAYQIDQLFIAAAAIE